jgi:hypothetical protein
LFNVWVGAKFHLRSAHKSLQRSIEPDQEILAKTASTPSTTLTKKYGGEVTRAAA